MKNANKVAMVLLVAVMFFFAGMSDLFAKGSSSRSSSSRSSSSRSSSSFSRPSSSSPATKPTSTKPSSTSTKPSLTSTKPSSTSRTTTAPKRTAAQQKSYEAAKQNGTASMTKTQSMDKFKSDPAMKTKYTSSYATKPTTRPSHIPQSTKGPDGTSYNVTYNQQYGGYGYMGPSGSWMMYDAMSDAIMLNALMNQNHYYYQGHPSLGSTTVVNHSSGGYVLTSLLCVIGGIVVIGFIVVIFSRL